MVILLWKSLKSMQLFIAYFPFSAQYIFLWRWGSGGSRCCLDNSGYIGDYGRGACISSGGGGRGGIGGSCVCICWSLIDKSKKDASGCLVAFVLLMPVSGVCIEFDRMLLVIFFWLVGLMAVV